LYIQGMVTILIRWQLRILLPLSVIPAEAGIFLPFFKIPYQVRNDKDWENEITQLPKIFQL